MNEFIPVKIYLALGSNLGDRRRNLEMAIGFLKERLDMGSFSRIYDTEPVGIGNQPRFLNMVIQASTRLTATALLSLVKGIEARLGRVPQASPRPIDIDILFYGEEIIEDPPDLIVPHPRLGKRAFVLKPLTEIAPDLVHPVNKKSITHLLDEVSGKEGVVLFEEPVKP